MRWWPAPCLRLRQVWVALLCLPILALAQPAELQQRQTEARKAHQALQKELKSLESRLLTDQKEEQAATHALQLAEQAVSERVRRLDQLDVMLDEFEKDLATTREEITHTSERIAAQRKVLAKQLRAQYASGLNAWSALLAGDDPQKLARELGYLEFVSRSRTEAIEALHTARGELVALQTAQRQQRASVEQTRERLESEREALAREEADRNKALQAVREDIASAREKAKNLQRDEARMSAMVEDLSSQMQRWREEQARQARDREAQAASRATDAQREAVLAQLPQGKGVQRGSLGHPVAGSVLARYGSKRPEGGSWRGVLLKAKEGDPVRAASPGTVVFAKWLAGYGNLLILDHDDGFLTIYGYNQSLLKDVGDTVQSGEIVARAGNTGGQLDSALYFELRHNGKPLDPTLYFKKP